MLAVPAKLTMPIRLPLASLPMRPPVRFMTMSINSLAPAFKCIIGVPVMLPERSKTSAISTGLLTTSGCAVTLSVTFRMPSQSILSSLRILSTCVIPILISFHQRPGLHPLAAFFRGAPGTAFPPAPRVPHWLLRYRMRPMGTLCRRTGIPHSDGFPIFPAAVDFAGAKRAHRRFPDGFMI